MQKLGWVLLVALFCLSCKSKQEQAEQQAIKAQEGVLTPTPVSKLPEGILAWATLGNPQKLIENAEKMVSKTSPLPAGVLSSSISQALIPFGFKDTRVIDLSKPAGFLILNPTQYNPPVLVALTTTGEQAVLESTKGNWTQDAKQDGILQLSREVVNAQAVFQGASGAKKTKQTLFLKFIGPTAIASLSKEALVKGGQVLFEQLKRSAPAQGIQAALQVENIRKTFQSQLNMMPMMLKTQVAQHLKNTMPEESSKFTVKMIEWYIDKLLALFNQTDQVGLALGVEQAGAVLHFSLAPVQDSFFQKFLASQQPAKLDMVHLLPNDASMVMAIDVQWHTLEADFLELTQEMLSFASKPEQKKKSLEWLSQWFKVIGDEFAFSQDMGPNGVSLVQVFDIKDEAKTKTLLVDFAKFSAEFIRVMDMSGLLIKGITSKNLPAHAGLEMGLSEIALDYQSLPKQQVNTMKALYGDKIKIAWSVFDKKLAMTIGTAAVKNLKKLIDRRAQSPAKGLANTQRFQSAAAGLDKKAGGYLFISVVELALNALKTNPAMAQSLAKIKLAESKSGMFFSFYQQDGQFVSSLRLPTDHLNEMGELFRSFSN